MVGSRNAPMTMATTAMRRTMMSRDQMSTETLDLMALTMRMRGSMI